jgi:hypothetical protein
MGELPVSQVNADMTEGSRGQEKNQIAGTKPTGRDVDAVMNLAGGGAGKPDTEYIVVDLLNETGTIHPGSIRTAHSMRRAPPLMHGGPQTLFKERRPPGCCLKGRCRR